MKDLIHIMIRDLQRIDLYPKLGFQIVQEIPEQVKAAFRELIVSGFLSHLIPK